MKSKLKKSLSLLLALVMALSCMSLSAFAGSVTIDDDNDTIGDADVINVTAATAQDVLDGKYGNINGKTINFTESINTVLELARPTKYQGSGTVYYNYVNSKHEENSTAWSENISSVMNGNSRYYRTLSNVTFTADSGVTLAGFAFSAGHVAGTGHDYVRDTEVTDNNNGYHKHSSLDNITFKGLKIVGNAEFELYQTDCTVSYITFDGCEVSGEGLQAIKFLADNQYFSNIIVKNCYLHNVWQGVYVNGINGLTIQNNKVVTTSGNAFALQSSSDAAGNPAKGTILVKENYVEGAGDRAIRLNAVSDTANITINNNVMVNSGDDKDELIKAGTITNGARIDLEYNYWNGKELANAIIAMSGFMPAYDGVKAGTFPVDVSGYCADGYTAEQNSAGTWTVAATQTTTYVGYVKSLGANVGNTIYLNVKMVFTDPQDGMRLKYQIGNLAPTYFSLPTPDANGVYLFQIPVIAKYFGVQGTISLVDATDETVYDISKGESGTHVTSVQYSVYDYLDLLEKSNVAADWLDLSTAIRNLGNMTAKHWQDSHNEAMANRGWIAYPAAN